MKLSKKYLIIGIPIVMLWLCALGFATLYDLDISLSVADPNSVFGRFFEIVGEPPAILFASFNFALVMAHTFRFAKLTRKAKLLGSFSALACVGTAAYTAIQTADYIAEWNGYPIHPLHIVYATLGALLISGAFIMIAVTMKEDNIRKYYNAACHCAAAAAATLVIIWAFKLTWGRVRFRQLDDDLSRFTPWYLPRGLNGYFSFPSGHTANAAVIFSVTYYFRLLPERLSKVKPVLTTLLSVWIVTVASSRVFVGAHYLSDVLFGMAITFAIVYFARPKKDI